jgi:hypothetical protein
MTWRELADELSIQARELSLGATSDVSSILGLAGSKLLVIQARTREAVDGAVNSYCQSGKWTNLETEPRAMLVRRLLFAENEARFLAAMPFLSGPSANKSELFAWLLIDGWSRHGLLELQFLP